jgi:hypothetical protein
VKAKHLYVSGLAMGVCESQLGVSVLCDDQRCEPCAEDQEHMDTWGRAGSQSTV